MLTMTPAEHWECAKHFTSGYCSIQLSEWSALQVKKMELEEAKYFAQVNKVSLKLWAFWLLDDFSDLSPTPLRRYVRKTRAIDSPKLQVKPVCCDN